MHRIPFCEYLKLRYKKDFNQLHTHTHTIIYFEFNSYMHIREVFKLIILDPAVALFFCIEF